MQMEMKRFLSERLVIALKYNNVYYLHRAAVIYIYMYTAYIQLDIVVNARCWYERTKHTHDCTLSVEIVL